MKIDIKDKALKDEYINAYVVECEAMYGDADGEGILEVGGFAKGKDEIYLEDFLGFCERMKVAYPHGRGGYDDYNHIEGFDKWFDADNLADEDYHALPEKVKFLSTYWLNDPQGDGMQASFEGYKVFYYDEQGIKYNTSVEL